MELGKIQVSDVSATKRYAKTITKGLRGKYISIEYTDKIWSGLVKNVVFTNGIQTKGILNAGTQVKIPPEVIDVPGVELRIGVCGKDSSENVVIPTLWAPLGTVQDGTPSDFEEADKELTPSVTEQILSLIGPMDELGTDAKDSLVAAINEILKLSGGDVSPEAIADAVTEYLTANPIRETDPTVPDWAKRPAKPEYTAAEVGALPDTYTPPEAPVQSVNGKTGVVNLTAEDVGALPDDTQIPTVPDWVKPIAAEVGQYFRVSAVDENGNVSAVEAVDIAGSNASDGNKDPVVLGELTLEEDITGWGSITIPLRDNPFDYSQLLITISAQLIEGGQFQGFLYGGGKMATATHLNTVFSTTNTTTVSVLVTLFADKLFTLATKMIDYQWNSTTLYSFENAIETDAGATDNALKFINSSAAAGAKFKVEGIPK